MYIICFKFFKKFSREQFQQSILRRSDESFNFIMGEEGHNKKTEEVNILKPPVYYFSLECY